MNFEDLICDHRDIEYGICELAKLDGEESISRKCEIRENLTEAFNGCWPYYGDYETPCYEGSCDYGCSHCPMKGSELVYWGDDIASLIKAIKNDADYKPTDTDIQKAKEYLK